MWVVRRPQHVLVGEFLPKPSQLHSHHVLQLTLSASGLLLPVIAGVALPPAAGILVGSNVPHTLSGRVVHVFVDPLEPLGRRLRSVLGGRPHLALDPLCTASFWGGDARDWLEGSPFPDSDEPVEHLLAELERAQATPLVAPLDGRIRNVIATLKGSLDTRTPLEQLADAARLSPSRLTHLFTEQVGMSIKQYVVWLRLVSVIDSLSPGKQLGALARDSGFPDQAAFNRTYRKAWGRTPSSFAACAASWARGPLATRTAARAWAASISEEGSRSAWWAGRRKRTVRSTTPGRATRTSTPRAPTRWTGTPSSSRTPSTC